MTNWNLLANKIIKNMMDSKFFDFHIIFNNFLWVWGPLNPVVKFTGIPIVEFLKVINLVKETSTKPSYFLDCCTMKHEYSLVLFFSQHLETGTFPLISLMQIVWNCPNELCYLVYCCLLLKSVRTAIFERIPFYLRINWFIWNITITAEKKFMSIK